MRVQVARVCATITVVLGILTAVFVGAILLLCAGQNTHCFGPGVLAVPVFFADMFIAPPVTVTGLASALSADRGSAEQRSVLRTTALINGLGIVGWMGLWAFLLLVSGNVRWPQ